MAGANRAHIPSAIASSEEISTSNRIRTLNTMAAASQTMMAPKMIREAPISTPAVVISHAGARMVSAPSAIPRIPIP